MSITLVQKEKIDCSNTISLHHNTSFFEHRRHVEVSRVDLTSRITFIASSTDANEVDDGDPMISDISGFVFFFIICNKKVNEC